MNDHKCKPDPWGCYCDCHEDPECDCYCCLDDLDKWLFCDHCGDRFLTDTMHHYNELPFEVSSELAGASGSICTDCNTKLTEENNV